MDPLNSIILSLCTHT